MYIPYLFKLENNKLFISNPFFVVSDVKKYNFSIIYPMSLIEIDKYILISAGEGDYTTICLKLKKKDFVKYCKHDVQNFDINKVDFEIIKN
jgi:hypothetical protein